MNRRSTAPSAGVLALIAMLDGAAQGGAPERFAGEPRLREAVLAHVPAGQGPRLLLDEADPNARHARFVADTALEWGVPQAWLDVGPMPPGNPDGYPSRHAVISQAHSGAATLERQDIETILASGAIVVAGAGNPGEGNARRGAQATVHYLTLSHPHWQGEKGRAWWRRALALMKTDRLIVARSSRPSDAGWEHDTSVHCGAAANWCYTVPAHPEGLGEGSTSKAATLLSAYLLFLSALEPQPIALLQACAKDIGPPGIDPIFGRGLVTAQCRELGAALERLEADQLPSTGNT